MMAAAFYTGIVVHRRFRPCRHWFRLPLLMLLLDVDRPNDALRPLRPLPALGLLNWRRENYFPSSSSLKSAVIAAVEQHGGARCRGPVYLLAQPRQFGVAYNPASFYFVHDGGAAPAYLLVEVHNTPWRERFCYVAAFNDAAGRARFSTATMAKRGHVSPFHPPQMEYQWRFSRAAARFVMRMRCLAADGGVDMEAVLVLRRRPLTRMAVLRYPFSSLLSLAGIYWQALRLWIKGAPVYPHSAT